MIECKTSLEKNPKARNFFSNFFPIIFSNVSSLMFCSVKKKNSTVFVGTVPGLMPFTETEEHAPVRGLYVEESVVEREKMLSSEMATWKVSFRQSWKGCNSERPVECNKKSSQFSSGTPDTQCKITKKKQIDETLNTRNLKKLSKKGHT